MDECESCSVSINIHVDTYYAHTAGWAKVRSQGGTNAVSNPVRDGRLRCSMCVDPKHKQIEGQESLFT